MPAHLGTESLKKPHDIITLRFSEVVKDHAKCTASIAVQTIHVSSSSITIYYTPFLERPLIARGHVSINL